MLSIQQLSKVYGSEENAFNALKNVDLQIADGEAIAIVGKSGSGKSTLMHLMVGLDTPTTGEVVAEEGNIFNLDTDAWRGKRVGIVFQQFFLQSNNSVLENVSLALKIQGVSKKQRDRAALHALTEVGLQEKAKNKANDLSGGQKQRVAIARAIVTKPNILVADEPTGNLDSENGAVVADLLFALNKKNKTTLVIVTHDEDLASRCQRVVRLSDGEIVSIAPGKNHKQKGKIQWKPSTLYALQTRTCPVANFAPF